MAMTNPRNHVSLLGHVGQDPEIKHLDSGTCVANFTMATPDDYTDKDGVKHEVVDWHRCVVFGKLAEAVVAKYVHKGKELFVSGLLKTRQWEDKDGNKRWTTEVKVINIVLLGSKGDGRVAADTPPTAGELPLAAGGGAPADDDDLPF